jgi:uncharacterized membrane protein YoaK (UPF0700 family)
MKLSAPTKTLFYITIIIFILGILAALVPSLGFGDYAVWVVYIAIIILAIGNLVKGK